MSVRVRIAPSPTGEPHVGTAYIALFARAFAKSRGGRFILRIEDTDQSRSSPESEAAIAEALRWLGLTWDEGPGAGGPKGPYRQSERTGIYREHAARLLASGHAYRCFCTPERLAGLRKAQEREKKGRLGYDRACRAMDPAESARRAAAGQLHVVRLRVPEEGTTSFLDIIRNEEIVHDNAGIDDQVLLKSDGFPTYHLANVVDDHLMGITHVTRAEEWIPSTPKHVLLYRAFGWEMPEFAHFPLLRNADRSKISKRKNPVSLRWYRAAGYLPRAMLNFLALLGGAAPAGDVEIFPPEVLEEGFELTRVKPGGPVFDLKKLDWMNGEYLRALDPGQFAEALADRARAAATYLAPIHEHVRKRCKRLSDFDGWTSTFFEAAVAVDPDLMLSNRLDKEAALGLLASCRKGLKNLGEPTRQEMERVVREVAGARNVKPEDLFMALRVALTGRVASLPLFETMEMLGRDATVGRIDDALGRLKEKR